MLRIGLFLVMTSLLAAPVQADVVYKWIDRAGQVHYTDLPPDQPDARLLEVIEKERVVYSEDGEIESVSPSAGTSASGGSQGTSASGFEPASRDTTRTVERDLQQARSEQCKLAQQRYKTYIESLRLYKEGPDGKREYLTESELSAARLEAKQAVDAYCKE
ncbi:MAG: DUF4124 domain-containing protein [Steroidobacteraceae bacterium]